VKIQTPGHQNALRTEFKVREPFTVDLDGTIMPVAVVADLSGAVVSDLGHPRDAMGIQITAAGGAGTVAQCVVVGVLGQGLIWKVHRVDLDKATAGTVQVLFGAQGVGIAGLVNTIRKGYSDLGVLTQPPLSFGGSTPLAAAPDGVLVGRFRVSTAVDQAWLPMNVVLRGGDFLNILNDTQDEALGATFHFTEYKLEDR